MLNNCVLTKQEVIVPILREYFKIDCVINLLDYGVSLNGLREELLPYCTPPYENNYRFVFLHYDTDYHITNDQPGLTLRNLQKILSNLDISNYFCIIVSQKDLQPHLDLLRDQETTDDCSIFCLQHPLQETMHYNVTDIVLDSQKVKHKFMCLNRIKRKHRTILYALLKEKNLLEQGIVSYGAKQ